MLWHTDLEVAPSKHQPQEDSNRMFWRCLQTPLPLWPLHKCRWAKRCSTLRDWNIYLLELQLSLTSKFQEESRGGRKTQLRARQNVFFLLYRYLSFLLLGWCTCCLKISKDETEDTNQRSLNHSPSAPVCANQIAAHSYKLCIMLSYNAKHSLLEVFWRNFFSA